MYYSPKATRFTQSVRFWRTWRLDWLSQKVNLKNMYIMNACRIGYPALSILGTITLYHFKSHSYSAYPLELVRSMTLISQGSIG